jgi:hypothetical protein
MKIDSTSFFNKLRRLFDVFAFIAVSGDSSTFMVGVIIISAQPFLFSFSLLIYRLTHSPRGATVLPAFWLSFHSPNQKLELVEKKEELVPKNQSLLPVGFVVIR